MKGRGKGNSLIRCGQGIISLCWRQSVSRYFMRLNIPTCDFLLYRYGGSVVGSFGHKFGQADWGWLSAEAINIDLFFPKPPLLQFQIFGWTDPQFFDLQQLKVLVWSRGARLIRRDISCPGKHRHQFYSVPYSSSPSPYPSPYLLITSRTSVYEFMLPHRFRWLC